MNHATSPYMQLNRIEFIVTYQCNGKCKHCQIGDNLNRKEEPKSISIGKATEAIETISGLFDISSVMTFGGEPLLYPDAVCAIQSSAKDCGIATRQLITNGFFTTKKEKCREVAKHLSVSGVNNLLLSVDAFHQEHIPLAPVRQFAEAIASADIPGAYLYPAWLVDSTHENEYNRKTIELLDEFKDIGIAVLKNNNVYLSGNAELYLSEYFDAPRLDMSDRCGLMPYTGPLTEITSISIVPNGDVMVCSFVIGNIYQEDIADILNRYDPYQNECMNSIINGGISALLDYARRKGISVDVSRCYSICDVCRAVVKQASTFP
jgi:MoaA/NifB/PqqE/SkfB family radical SAM enzyme